MNGVKTFTLGSSGTPFVATNDLVAASSIGVVYTVAGAPATLTIVVEGIKNATGAVYVLDSYVGTTNTTRTITLNDTYDRFRVTAYWTGGSKVSVNASLSSTGPGPTWSASSLAAVQSRSF